MKKLVLSAAFIGVLTLMVGGNPSSNPSSGAGLPTLHVIKSATLAPAYSCRSAEEFSQGYQGTALFLSAHSKKRNAPDLLFNGGCGAPDYFEASTAGDDMSMIADLGTGIALEDVSASRAFNLQNVHSAQAYSKFARTVKVELGHTYAVLLNNQEKRGLFVFTVTEYEQNKRVNLDYAVKAYQAVITSQVESAGNYDWNQKSER